MNFDQKFRSVISSLFATQKAHIVDAGLISEPFRVERGVRQGDPLSPLLYILAINPLIQAINQNIKGIQVNNSTFKIAAYADDLSVGISSPSDWSKLLEILAKYEKASNAIINKAKSTLIPLTNIARRVELPNQNRFKLSSEDQNSFTILGYTVDIEGHPAKTLWSEVTKKIKNRIQDLTLRNLSFKGKILASKTLLISKIWYLAYLLPPTRKQLNEINSLITNWIKKNSRMLPQYSTFQLSTEQGGLAAPILKDMLDVRLLSIWIKLLSSNTFWARTEREKATIRLQNKRKLSPGAALSQSPCKIKGWPDSWKPYITAWRRFKGSINTTYTWPWTLEQIKINDIEGQQFTVKKVLQSWYKSTEQSRDNSEKQIEGYIPYKWLKTKWVLNKKKDIFWRLNHRALPLGYRLVHIDQNNLEDCPNCPYVTQTIEHFALKCPLSKIIWETTYRLLKEAENDHIPNSLEEIFQATNIKNTKKREAATWLHITTIYEIWCWYTQARWGNSLIPQETIAGVIKIRLKYEINLLYKLAYRNLNSRPNKARRIISFIEHST
ncbi:13816_t:CDS:1 [Ambispora leptoticha]|uniref:13816_t:CDS:1 n=1 Tax=Ambispora leptoticha TaxID=144679 RepID=A0A9N9CGZ2_9GLOM|nr:13816_t:CDS:1 [Ambispora leptoticha]